MAQSTCSIPDCNRPVLVKSRGWCNRHWIRWRRHGSPTAGGRTREPGPLEERVWRRVTKTDGCWLWDGGRSDGRGVINVNRRTRYAYRVVYELVVGPIPEGLTLDHLCRNPNCVNPAHLEPVTAWVNTSRTDSWMAQRARATHCIHGHEFTPENTYRTGPDKRHRACRECARRRDRERRRGKAA